MSRFLFVPLILLITATISPGAMSRGQVQNRRVIEITAERFEFWPSEVVVDQGEEVELRIRSADTIHGFRIAGTGTNLVVPKRGKGQAVTTFTATTPGRYTIECNRMCGAGHNFMRAVLIVREPSASGAR
jgi:heme/copper-type cytochrome/quinol oxidase subunit 2